MGLVDSLRVKYELYRLEQRYTRRDKRKTFASGATYVDGEYIHVESPTTSTRSDKSWGSSGGNSYSNSSNSSSTGNTWSNKRGASVRVKELMSRSTKA